MRDTIGATTWGIGVNVQQNDNAFWKRTQIERLRTENSFKL